MSFHFNFIQYLTKKNMEEQLFSGSEMIL